MKLEDILVAVETFLFNPSTGTGVTGHRVEALRLAGKSDVEILNGQTAMVAGVKCYISKKTGKWQIA